MEREPERWEILVGRRDGGQALQDGTQVVPKEADESAKERRCAGVDDRRPVTATPSPA